MAVVSRLASAFLPSRQVLKERQGQPQPQTLRSPGNVGRIASVRAANVPLGSSKPKLLSSGRNGERAGWSLQATAVTEVTGSVLRGAGLRFAIVAARFNEIITKPLLAGALETFARYGVSEEDVVVVWVPGSFEIPVVAQAVARSGKYQAVLCIGAVIRGATSHYDAVANSAASGIMNAGLSTGVPCIFGVLTCDNMEQAIDRAGGKAGNKGAEAAITAIEMAALFRDFASTL